MTREIGMRERLWWFYLEQTIHTHLSALLLLLLGDTMAAVIGAPRCVDLSSSSLLLISPSDCLAAFAKGVY